MIYNAVKIIDNFWKIFFFFVYFDRIIKFVTKNPNVSLKIKDNFQFTTYV